MYAILIALHSLFRWLVVLSLTYATAVACQGWITKRAFSKYDNLVRHGTATIAHIQLLLGLALYFVSPIVQYFLQNFSEGVHQREIRFFGMEHIFMMLLASIRITRRRLLLRCLQRVGLVIIQVNILLLIIGWQ